MASRCECTCCLAENALHVICVACGNSSARIAVVLAVAFEEELTEALQEVGASKPCECTFVGRFRLDAQEQRLNALKHVAGSI